MKLVQHLLDAKGDEVVSIAPDASVFDAIKLMADKGVGSLVVMEGADIKGIVTERDYARKVIIRGRSSESTSVGEIMTADVITTTTDQTVRQCMALMTEKCVRHLPVVADAAVIGMISMRDLVNAIISDQQEEIEQLEHYISG